MHLYWPIARTTAAALLSFGVVSIATFPALVPIAPSVALTLVFFGALYTQFVEYWSHRGPMHRGFPWLENVRQNHLEHHRVFHGGNYQTRDPELLNHIVGRYWVFPVLLFAHYTLLALVFPATMVVWFLFGALLHYLTFELTHWFSHIEDNAFDRTIACIPVLGPLRAYQIEHHRLHHEIPVAAFNFNPPYLGDRLYGHMPAPFSPSVAGAESGASLSEALLVEAAAPSGSKDLPPKPALAAQQAKPPARVWQRPLARYGTVAACGMALVGAAVLAHGLWTTGKRETPAAEQSA